MMCFLSVSDHDYFANIIGRYGYSDHGVTTVQLNDIEIDETSLVEEWTKLMNNEYWNAVKNGDSK